MNVLPFFRPLLFPSWNREHDSKQETDKEMESVEQFGMGEVSITMECLLDDSSKFRRNLKSVVAS